MMIGINITIAQCFNEVAEPEYSVDNDGTDFYYVNDAATMQYFWRDEL